MRLPPGQRHNRGLPAALLVLVGMLSACAGSPPTAVSSPAPTLPAPTLTEDRAPRATPAERSAPTLPPAWTSTFTALPTLTFTPTTTPTETAIPSEADLCALLVIGLTDLPDGSVIGNANGVFFQIGIEQRDATVLLEIAPVVEPAETAEATPAATPADDAAATAESSPDTSPTDAPLPATLQPTPTDPPPVETQTIELAGGEIVALNLGYRTVAGTYTWTVRVNTTFYTGICVQSGTVVIRDTYVEPPTEPPTALPTVADVAATGATPPPGTLSDLTPLPTDLPTAQTLDLG